MNAFCSTSSTVTPNRLIAVMVSNNWSTKRGAKPMDGSSISSRRGLDIMARPIASICCSPPDSVPANWVIRSLSRVEDAKHLVQVGRQFGAAGAAAVGAHAQVLPHRQAPEHPAALGNLHQAERHQIVRRDAGDVAGRPASPGRAGGSASRRSRSAWWSCPRRWPRPRRRSCPPPPPATRPARRGLLP